MKSPDRLFLVALILCSTISSSAQQTSPTTAVGVMTPAQILEESKGSVAIIVAATDKPLKLGTGFFLQGSGMLLTNLHVVENAELVGVKLPKDSEIYWAKTARGVDSDNDLAVLNVELQTHTVLSLRLGDSDSVHVGESIVVVSNPEGLEQTVSNGLISGIRELDGRKLFQITAPVSEGSSGGPVFNERGEVIGVVVASLESGQNLNFAIPINYAKHLLNSPSTTPISALPKRKVIEEQPQDSAQHVLTNSDVLSMAKSGIGEQTILLAIQQGPTKFDTSPQALIELKNAGLSDRVLNAVLVTPSSGTGTLSPSEPANQEASKLFDKALDAFGSNEKLTSFHASRWKGSLTQFSASRTVSSQVERITVFPDKIYMAEQVSTGVLNKIVVTPEFNYSSSAKMTGTVPTATLDDLRGSLKIDPIYVAQHRGDYSCVAEGMEQVGNVTTAKIKISGQGREVHWNIDPTNGRLLRIRSSATSGETTTDLSDWRQVDGVYVPFGRHIAANGRTTEVAISEYQVNPTIDTSLFEAPSRQIATGFTFKVLQSESVPYVVQSGGGVTTNCQIYGSDTNLSMNCHSYDNTIRWRHVLNAMLVEASDGNAYIIACDRAWRWSKCSPLRAGDTFRATNGGKGIVVQFVNPKGEEKEATYSVLQSRSRR